MQPHLVLIQQVSYFLDSVKADFHEIVFDY